jgi:hypothetical protein
MLTTTEKADGHGKLFARVTSLVIVESAAYSAMKPHQRATRKRLIVATSNSFDIFDRGL